MKFIQWACGPHVSDPVTLKDFYAQEGLSYNAMFRLNTIDIQLLDDETMKWLNEENSKYWEEVREMQMDGVSHDIFPDFVPSETPKDEWTIGVSKDDDIEAYRLECARLFNKLIGIKNLQSS